MEEHAGKLWFVICAGRIEPDKSSGLAGTPDETGTLIRYFILTFIDRN